jgi:hypothetical protein
MLALNLIGAALCCEALLACPRPATDVTFQTAVFAGLRCLCRYRDSEYFVEVSPPAALIQL